MGHEWDAKLGKQAVDARLEMDPERGLIVVPDSPGTKVNLSETMAELPRYWGEMDELRIPIIMNEKQPRVKAQDLQGMGELSSFSTWFNTSEENRSHNLRLAAAGINGSMIEPGEVFSFNSKVGPRTYENGFSDAMVIVGDKFELGAGGGVCQVSTTLYNACLLAGLEIVERHNHNLAVSYVPLGRDATVYYGAQDFKFKNNTASPVYLRAYTLGGKLIMQVYGNTFFKQKIGLSSTVDQVIDFKEVYEVSKDLPPGKTRVDHAGIPGYSVRSYRSFYDSQGKLVRQEQIGRDYYRPLNKLIYTGPKVQNSANDIPDNKIEETVEPPSDEGQAPPEGETSTMNEVSTEPQL
ncbi:VanW family protein [Syntrophomonas palmitatica]|uniref:VanW family protein n=1 Tax=Syntrophomonas palmitatica TaxID=402877 RepID=UPI001A9A3AA7|nr:VanW family protein [Syntrophomonas palmitatica]